MVLTSVLQQQGKGKQDNSWIYFSVKQKQFLVKLYLEAFWNIVLFSPITRPCFLSMQNTGSYEIDRSKAPMIKR